MIFKLYKSYERKFRDPINLANIAMIFKPYKFYKRNFKIVPTPFI